MPKGKSKAAVEELDDELELMEDEDEADEPKKSKSKGKNAKASAPKPVESTGMGAGWLAEYINEELGTNYTAANVRVILRKMAKDEEFEREIGTDRSRYQFTGEKDPIVRAVLKRVKAGEADQAKSERLSAARSGASSKGRKAKEEVEVEEKPVKTKSKSKKSADVEEAPVKPVRRKRKSSDDDE